MDVSFASSAGAGIAARLAEALDGLAGLARGVRAAGVGVGALVAVAGLAALLAAYRAPRVAAILGGAAVGALGVLAARAFLAAHLGVSPELAVAIGAALVAAASATVPAAFPAASLAVPAALLGANVPVGGRAELGAAVAGGVGAVLGLFARRPLAIVVAAQGGGLLLAVGLVGALGARPLAAELADRPFALLALGLVTGIAGAAWQLGPRPPRPGADASPPRQPEA